MICEKEKLILKNDQILSIEKDEGCPVDVSKRLMEIAMKEACGIDVFCREGTRQAYQIIKDITEGRGRSGDDELLLELFTIISEQAGCELTRAYASKSIEFLNNNQEEWDKHIKRNRCTTLTCKSSFTLYVEPKSCTGCGHCLDICPEKAITGGKEMIHLIASDICSKCMACIGVCPVGAINKAGIVKPRLPESPIPVGTFIVESSSEEGESRRRRRRRG
ncbi:NADH-ubiquinone oxidoreductase-F iron-sulfur binding region domain-containing protein [Alloiococcus sp. CFN-8]|uniref:DUF362 domain-containing protein n=1 Tax=Alloiococcus sp. CFN-8 TaxID=3416081 RepID=UPI003CF6498A